MRMRPRHATATEKPTATTTESRRRLSTATRDTTFDPDLREERLCNWVERPCA
jgi:hypothetical protein